MASHSQDRAGSAGEATCVGLALLGAVALHVGGVLQPFFADDYLFLEQVRGRSLLQALASPDPLGNFLRPVSRPLYFWLLAHLGGESPAWFHAAGLIVFLAGAIFVYLVARRLLGWRSALPALLLLVLHYSADVPLRWASGSQDLLAVCLGALCLLLHGTGKRAWAALALALALLSKETVAGAVLVALAWDRAGGRPWRAVLGRGAGLIAVTLGWAAWWIATWSRRPAAGQVLSFHASQLPAAVVHFVQTAAGLEFRQGGRAFGHWSPHALLPALLAAVLVGWLARGRGAREDERPRDAGSALAVGATWTGVGILSIAPVSQVWSAYFYLWALAGFAVLLSAALARSSPVLRAIALGALVLLSGQARLLDEFATSGGSWSWQSHVNRHYIDRSLRTIGGYLRAMRAARPRLPARSTVFFADVPPSLGWQTADGPLLRWAYRDSTVRSYFLTQFTRERASRGPVYFFAAEGDSLRDRTSDPRLLPSFAFSMLIADSPRAAIEVLDAAAPGRASRYWRGLARWAIGDTSAAKEDLRAAGLTPGRRLESRADERLQAAGDDTTARLATLVRLRREAALNSWVHARLAALLLARGADEGVIEAYAYRVLAPQEADAWRKWASAQLARRQYEHALSSLEHYVERVGPGRDPEAEQVLSSVRRLVRGDLAARSLRSAP